MLGKKLGFHLLIFFFFQLLFRENKKIRFACSPFVHRRIEIAYPHLCESKDATWDTEHPLDLKGTKYAAVVQWACTVSENCRDAFEVLAQLDSEHKLAYQVKKNKIVSIC